MGGKNKKNRHGSSTAVQGATAAANRPRAAAEPRPGGEDAAKKQTPRNSNVAPGSKESNKQGPKTYSFASSSDSGVSVNHDKSVLKVVIEAKLEKRIISLINEHKKLNSNKGTVSGRLTSKKLQDLYMALQKLSFKAEHIEEAMTNTVLYGGDLHAALDWLCLNLPDDALPEGFSQQFVEEEQRARAKFQAPPQRPSAANESATEKGEEGASLKGNPELTMKEWILRYAEQGSDDDDDDDDVKEEEKETTLEKFDPNERYLELTAKLLDARAQATATKQDKDKQGQKEAQERIRGYQQEMKSLEDHPLFNPAVKIPEVKSESKQPKPALPPSEDEPLNFNLFEKKENAPEEKAKKKPPLDIRNFDYTSRSWTGKSPKQFLIDWCRKHYSKSPNPSFEKVPVGKYWKSRVKIIKSHDDVMCVCPTIVTEDSMQAQHLAATLALYELTKGQSVHQLLPPTYRNVWLEWSDAEKQVQEQNKTESNKPRDQFITKLLNKLKVQQNQLKSCSQTQMMEDPEDSWENLACDEEQHETCPSPLLPDDLEPIRNIFRKSRDSMKYKRLLNDREQLPVFARGNFILETLKRHRVIVVAGETGSGKSTQVPQFLLEDLLFNGGSPGKCNIVCTQPRRISAMSLATRVCEELGCDSGPGGKNSLCGYQIRMESRTGEATRLLYCTTGILLRKLQEDSMLKNISHIIVDEVHERTVQSDFLLIILREILHKRSDLHLVLMSATVDCEKFSSYFTHCPIIRISGRTFPVEVFHLEDVVEATGFVLEQDSEYCQKFLEDEEEITLSVTGKGGSSKKYQEFIPAQSGTGLDLGARYQRYSSQTRHAVLYMNPNKINLDLILELLVFLDISPEYRNVEGAVLIFLPGLADIQQLYDILSSDKRFHDRRRYKLIALHSILSSQDQAEAFILPPAGTRKIVLATNIAETGITIPDVVFVIDAGRTKENRYHESSQMSSLVETFISKASALQRQGRAGRVRNGYCFRLYTRERFESFMEYSVPEILRVPLEELCLHIMKCDLGSPEDFLSKALDPPQLQVISNAMSLLRKIGACELSQPKLTPLGQHLAALPVNVKIGKMLIFGAIFGCLDAVATLAATMTEKSPFVTPIGEKDRADLAKSSMAVANSDHVTIFRAYLGWKAIRPEGYAAEMSYCRKNFLNRKALLTIEDVKQELIRLVRAAGFECPRSVEANGLSSAMKALSAEETSLLKAILTAGLYDNVGKILFTKSVDITEKLACIVETAQGKAQVHPSSVNRDLQIYGWLLYQEKVKYSKVFLRETTLISPFPVLLFGGDIAVQHRERLLTVDDWIHFQAPVKIAVIFKELRILIESVLKQKLENPKMSLKDDMILNIIKELIKTER
ncbi:ATP-dependent RNA helicase DHX29 [Xenopus laevis]|uniref:ATP-dependent RNA helicase dhx29 n=1 Tax=Xenopus laevis TaxID=8355 RepID=DHX29_XENLA|nr:ATP-dependent RNA helicase DHX29 [Xenopus laevis]A3KMI0.1 RecName: Full=ATP-dependent RNA helicase dhx29; AltName: Full=DEAH box protein 29 [Xenopus laevis]AAI31892.1 LOC100049090 protein [Xenopus laevis]